MNTAQKIAISYLCGLAILAWGYGIGRYEVFPFQYVEKIEAFLGWKSPVQEMTLEQKFLNELGVKPAEFIYDYPEIATQKTTELVVPGTRDRRENPQVFIDPKHAAGYRALFGALDFEDTLWGGVLLDPAGQPIHAWHLSTEHLPLNKQPDHQKNLYGIELLPDGSVIYNMQEPGGGIVRIDACGNILWNLEGIFHHTVTMTEDHSAFWTFQGPHLGYHHVLQKVSTKSGEVLKTIDMKDVYEKNEFDHIFYLQKNTFPSTFADWMDISHGNDIEELPASKASDFPGFAIGDLLISYRNHNLIFIVDPKTLDIKWWRIGATGRQHDPDWEDGGFITAFSNNSVGARKGHSDIVQIDVDTMEHTILVDGEKHSIFSLINARHQLTDYGTRLITSSTQGWILEVDNNDQVVFSFLNNYETNELKALHVSDAFRFKPNYFSSEFWESCGA